MQKLLMIILSALLFLSLALGVLFLFSFTQKGNTMLQPYIKEALEEKIGLPIEVKSFNLEFGTVRLTFLIDNQALVQVTSDYDLLDLSFDGLYQVSAKEFSYEEVTLGKADLKGDFKGVGKEIDVRGEGRALGASMNYSFKMMNQAAQKIILQIKGAQLAGVLKLVGKPALAQGKIDIEVNMPNIGEETAEGYGHMMLHEASFNRPLVKKLYGYSLPEKNDINAKSEAKLHGDFVEITGELRSDLFNVLMKETVFNVNTQALKGTYALDVKDMGIVTKNKLSGAFMATGNVEVEKGQVLLTGNSTSFDGVLRFSVAKSAKVTLENLSLQKILPLFKQVVYAKGKVSGTLLMNDISGQSGEYDLRIDKGTLLAKEFAKKMEVEISELNQFSLISTGKIDKEKLTANTTLHSTLANMTFSSLKYDFKDKTLISNYEAVLHDIRLVLPKAKVQKGEKISANGVLKFKEILSVSGEIKTPFGNITLKNIEYDEKGKSVKSAYVVDIPELKQLEPYIDKKLYGPMVLQGVFSKEKMLKLTGNTTSLGGKIDYTLHGNDLQSTITAVPLLNILGVLGHKQNFLGEAFGKGRYDLKEKSGVVDLDIRSFQIKSSSLTNTIKMFLGKDPARIMFTSTKFHADIKKKITTYTLLATGTRSSITIRDGKINKVTNQHSANFTLVYEKYTVHGKIKGSADNPDVTFDTNTILKEQLSSGKLKEKLEKALGGKAEKFLKGLSF